MASTPSVRPKPASRWGSILSGAVAGIESRLDTILTDDSEASAKSRAAEAIASTEALAVAQDAATTSRSQSRSRVNDRLQERLAKALAAKSGSQITNDNPSPVALSVGTFSSATSRSSMESARHDSDVEGVGGADHSKADGPKISDQFVESSEKPDDGQDITIASPSLIIDSGSVTIESEVYEETPKSLEELQAEILQMRSTKEIDDKQKQTDLEEMMERIDALQAKLQYLAKETIAAAQQVNTETLQENVDKRLAEKDEKIAGLMEEGQALSKTEMRHLARIRKMTNKSSQDDKTIADLKRDIKKTRQSEFTLRSRVNRLEAQERDHNAQTTKLVTIEANLELIQSDIAERERIISTAKQNTQELERKVQTLEAASTSQNDIITINEGRIKDLIEELENAKIERQISDDKYKIEKQGLMREKQQDADKAQAVELELKSEIASLEIRMETLRNRAEEASSDQVEDSQAKLLRQIETLQTQYSLAADNWRTIEVSLNARLTAVESERDETVNRETEARKKARNLSVKCRSLEDDFEKSKNENNELTGTSVELQTTIRNLETRLKSSEKTLEEARADLANSKQLLEATLNSKRDEDLLRRTSTPASVAYLTRRTSSPNSHNRKTSVAESNVLSYINKKPGLSRGITGDSTASSLGPSFYDRPSSSRRSSTMPYERYGDPNAFFSLPVSRKSSAMGLVNLVGSPALSVITGLQNHDHDDLNHQTRRSYSHSRSHARSSSIIATEALSEEDDDDLHSQIDKDIDDGLMTTSRHSRNHNTHNVHQRPSSRSGNNTLAGDITANAHFDVISASTIHTGPSVQLVERMSSSIRKLEAEKASHRDEMQRLSLQRDEARDQLVIMMREADDRKTLEERLDKIEKDAEKKEERYDACLEMLGEREEEVAELKSDLVDMRAIYKDLVAKMGIQS